MNWLRDLLGDLRLAARALRRQPGFSAFAVGMLALGLGGTTAVFSILDVLVLRPLPFVEPDRLVRIHRTVAADGSDSIDRQHSPGAFLAFTAASDVFQTMAAIAMGNGHRVETAADRPAELLLGARVSADYFSTFRVGARLGRVFSADEYQPGRDRVLLISSQLWNSRFGGDPRIVGRSIRIDGEAVTVIGVMPPEMHDPLRYWSRGLFWRPLVLPAGAEHNYQNQGLRLIGRLAPEVSMGTARAAVKAIARRLDADHQTNSGAALVTPQETGALDPGGARMLWLSMALAAVVLLLTSINLAGVQLARLANRRYDLAVRAALGAGRARLVRLLITENLLVSVLGCGVGFLVAHWCTDLLASRITIGFRWVTVGVSARLDARAFAFAVLLALITAVVVGTVPAWLSAREAAAQALRQGSRGVGTPVGWLGLRKALVVVQMTLALILLAAGGLFLRGLQRFVQGGPGWDTDGLLTAQLVLSADQRGEQRAVFLEQVQQQLATLPGVEAVALAGALPIVEDTWRARAVWPLGTPRPRAGAGPTAFGNAVSPDYFRALGIGLRQGRTFDAADRKNRPVMVINESMARGLWPNEPALGKRVGHPEGDPARPEQWATVVGVVEDTRFAATLTAPSSRFQLYQPLGAAGAVNVVLRTSGPPEALAAELRRRIGELSREATLDQVVSARSTVDETLANMAVLAWTVFAFAVLGLLVAALGTYGLFSGYVIQRTREIGVRMALGARADQVLRLVLGQGLRLALLGGALGVAGAIVAARVLTSLVAQVPAHEPAAVALLAVVLVALALFACWLPARRAARVDPMVALRHD